MRTSIHRWLSLVLIVQLVISSFYTQPALASVTVADPPNVQPLSVCWLTQSKATGSTDWQIVNLNLTAVSSNPDVKLRYNWRVFGAPNIAGQTLQAASGWDTVKANKVNTVYSQSMLVEWYLVIKGVQGSILGSAQANAGNDSLCPNIAVASKANPVVSSGSAIHHEQPSEASAPVISAAQVPVPGNDTSYKIFNADNEQSKLNSAATSSNYYWHTDTIGVYRPSSRTFYLNDVNAGTFAASSVSMAGSFGSGNFYPITGDWAGNHYDSVGLYDETSTLFYLKYDNLPNTNISPIFSYGMAGDQPVSGRWVVGAAHDGIGVYRASNGLILLRNALSSGSPDFSMVLGSPGDVPVFGDWNGDGATSVGIYRPSGGTFYLGGQACNSCSVSIGYTFNYGSPNMKPIAGDWTNQGYFGVAIYDSPNISFYLKKSLKTGYADISFREGVAGDIPLAGRWGSVVPPSPTPTSTFTPSKTYTPTYTFTPSNTATFTPTYTFTPSKTYTPTYTFTPSNTATFTPTYTFTPSKTYTPTYTFTPSNTATFTPTYTFTPSNTYTPTYTFTPSNTATFTPTYTFTPSKTYTPTYTFTPSNTATFTPTYTFTPTQTFTPTPSSTATFTPSQTPTPTNTPTFTPSNTFTSTYTPTATFTPSQTAISANTATPTVGQLLTPTVTPILPNNVTCLDWRIGAAQGWVNSPWNLTGTNVVWDTNGMYGSSSSGTTTVGAYYQMPTASTSEILFNTNNVSGFQVAQGSSAPTANAPLTNMLTANADGGYTVTQPFIEVRWSLNVPVVLANTPVFYFACLGAVLPTQTPSATATQTNAPSATNTSTPTASLTSVPGCPVTNITPRGTIGRIVANNDDWVWNDQGFSNAPDGYKFALNVPRWLMNGRLGSILLYSSDTFAFSPLLKTTLSNAGYAVTSADPAGNVINFTLPNILQYDAIYVGYGIVDRVDNCVLIDYVNAGGSVYVFGGAAERTDIEANAWNVFMNAFGLNFVGDQNKLNVNYPVNSPHPVMQDIHQLNMNNGDSLTLINPADPRTIMLATFAGKGLVAVYDPAGGLSATPTLIVTSGPSPTITATFTPTLLPTTTLTPSPTLPALPPIAIQGCIATPLNHTSVSGLVPVNLCSSAGLVGGAVDYWPADDPNSYHTLVSNVNAPANSTIATLDTTLLANNSYVIRVRGQNTLGQTVNDAVLITAVGDYKPGRVRFSVTDLTVPIAGLPITIGRTYDSLNRAQVGDFGNGWSLDLGSPQIQVNQAHDVTITQANGQRVTFTFSPQPLGFMFYRPAYLAEAGVYGKFEPISACGLLVFSGAQYVCFPPVPYQPAGYKYTDPYGRVFVYSVGADPITQKQTSQLVSITDLNHNTLTFGADGIRSSVTGKAYVKFDRNDPTGMGRIMSITDTNGKVYRYTYDAVVSGDLDSVVLPQVPLPQNQVANPVIQYHYWPGHYFKDVVDPLNQKAVYAEYNPDGRLKQQTQYGTDTTISYLTTYDYNLATHTTTQTNPDTGVNVTTYNDYGDLLTQVQQQQANGTVLHQVTYDYYPGSHNVRNVTTAIDGNTSEVTTYKYDGSGNRIEVINNGTDNAAKSVMQMTYNQYSGPSTIKNGNGTVWTVGYDDSTGMPKQVTDTLNGPSSLVGGYTWDTHGSPLTKTDGNGNSTTYGTDSYGNVTSVTAPIQGTRTATTYYVYDDMGRQIQAKDARNHITNYVYDDLGNVISVENVRDGGLPSYFTYYEYDLNRNKTAMIDPRGLRTTYGYDYANRLVTVTYSDKTFSTYTYDFRGNKLSETDQAGHVMTYGYDVAGQLVKMTRVGDGTTGSAITTYQYDLAGRKTLETDPNLNQTTYHYNHLGQMDIVTAPGNIINRNNYDDAGQLTDSYDSKGYHTHYVYDIRGRLTDTYYDDDNRAAHPNPVHQDYDNAGRVTARTDQNGKVTAYVYFDNGQLRTVTQSLSQPNGPARLLSTNYLYDDVGNLQTITDAKSQVTSFQYDELNRQVVKTWPDGSQELFQYDSDGNLTDHALPNDAIPPVTSFGGNNNHYTYAANSNLLKTVNYFDGQNVTYGYTSGDMRQTITDARGTTIYGYDALSRVNSVTLPNNQAVGYGYDLNGNRTSMSSPAGTIGYDYYGTNQLKDVKDASGSHIADYTYDMNGMRSNLSYINGVSIDYGYNNLNQLTSIMQHKGPQPIASYTYTLDATGSRTAVKDTVGIDTTGTTTTWTYDDLYRLIGESRSAGNGGTSTPAPTSTGAATFAPATITPGGPSTTPAQTGTPTGGNANPSWATMYGYDDVGNRIKKTENGQSTLYAYNILNQLTCSGTDVGIASNNCINAQQTYTYNGRGDLRTVSDTMNAMNNVSYLWDARDQMTGATVGAQTVINRYDDSGHRVQQTVGAQTTNYLWDEFSPYGDVIQEADGTGAPTVNYVLGGAELLTQTRGATANYYLHDGQNSVRALTDTSGNATDRYVYDAFGTTRNQTGTTANIYQYTGQQFDRSTGLYDLRARYYNTTTGGFNSRDVLYSYTEKPNQDNIYGYVQSNPINQFDPSGRFVEYSFGESPVLTVARAVVGSNFRNGFALGLISSLVGYIVGTFVKTLSQCASSTIEGQECQKDFGSKFIINILINGPSAFISALLGALVGGFVSAIGTGPVTYSYLESGITRFLARLYSYPYVVAAGIRAYATGSFNGFLGVFENGVKALASVPISIVGNIAIDFGGSLVQVLDGHSASSNFTTLAIGVGSAIAGAVGAPLSALSATSIFLNSFISAAGTYLS